jgi:hypothetical protein
MNPDKYPVEWQGRTVYLSGLTADVKATFAKWLAPRYVFAAFVQTQAPGLTDEMRKHAGMEHRAAQSLANTGGIYWAADPSMPVADALATPDGVRFLTRLLLGESARVREPDGSVREWTDAELDAFLKAKDPQRPDGETPVTDYQTAMDTIWANELPKAPTGSPPSPGPVVTTGSSPSSPPATSESPASTPAA